MLSLLFLLPSFLYLINSFAIDLSFHKKSSTVIMSSENKFPLKTESPVPSSSPKTNKRNRQDEMLSPSNPDFDVATGKFLSKDALFEVQKLFVLDGSRRVRRKVKEIKAEKLLPRSGIPRAQPLQMSSKLRLRMWRGL